MITADTAAVAAALRALPDNPRIVASGNHSIPWELVRLLDEHVESFVLNTLNGPPGLPEREGVVVETSFVGAGQRRHPGLRYVPSRLSLVPVLFRRSLPVDAVLLHCSPPRDGVVSLGIEVNVLPAAIEACRERGGLVVAQVNERMPFTYGDALVPVEHIDVGLEVSIPLPTPPAAAPLGEDARVIGERVAAMVPDGATLQMGIGAVPDAVLAALTGHRGLRLWTEMFSDGVLALDAAGALDDDHPLTTSFLFGTQRLYDWLDGNRRVHLLRTERTNDPALIARQRFMTSINTALEVDLFGQANASRIDARIHSGFGGQTDFIVGALHAQGGQSIMALRSWHPKADVSTIVPLVDEPVTSFQASAIVTEQGTAPLFGCSEKEQAAHLIERAAHPRVRAELWEEAHHLGLA
ncbi:acetyl-CoA hydrolase/transferase family protein [Ornithinimicrobium tianjinense]|uniref:4-hydroxybutyrate CoA-transferase n=1 Tax=Ornithinimicrobium tianjinense TaxID=1195761 RepID=A0A917BHA2_9MICO|nr:acetyl-CoA hydrolase/transferase C-terminal domain-containing protein [Ornithinimicrobium tianjinense]GGF41350.1 4-hydroxybutyrate CoA-transferase [Ornithinimicrobium tianjinense]